jgi:antitoxin component YwqK of YwqJK toxin-antitoxin module
MKKPALLLIIISFFSFLGFTETITLSTGDVITTEGWGIYYEGEYYMLSGVQTVTTPAGRLDVDYRLYVYESGKIMGCYPVENNPEVDTPAGKFKVNKLFFFENGRIKYCDFMETQLIGTPAGNLNITRIYFFESGKIKSCQLPWEEPEVIITPAGSLELIELGFYENGKMEFCSLSYNETSAIITPLGKMNVNYIGFYESGKIKECISRDYTRFIWTEDGVLIETRYEGGA